MALEIVDSRYGEVSKSLPDLIIIILAKEYPLRMGEINKKLKRDFNVKLSFPAIRKSLNIMTEKKILKLKDKSFSINKNYILENKRLSDQLLKNYFIGEKAEKSLPAKSKESHSTYMFENLIQADQFWTEIVLEWAYNLKENDDKRFFFHGPHCWYIFGHLGLESTFLLELKSHNIKPYYLVEGRTIIDKWSKNFYESHHVNYAINKNSKIFNTAIGVFGDYIIQYEYPEKLFKEMEKFYNSSKNFETMKITEIALLLKMKTNINLIVMKNKTIASTLKEEILANVKK